jgi:cellobiose transport system permease protein
VSCGRSRSTATEVAGRRSGGTAISAGRVDGANRWRQFWTVTLPLLRPTLIFAVILSTIGGIQLFTEPLIFAGNILGGNTRQFQTVAMYMFEKGIDNPDTAGYGAAVAWAIFVLIILISLLNFLLVRRSVRGESQ